MPAFIKTGMLRWSPDHDLFAVADDRQIWLLEMPFELEPQADDLLHDRVIVEGGRIGPSRIAVARIARCRALIA